MANTYSQINIHCVFAVKGRENVITKVFRDDLHKYMSGILKNDNAFPLAVGGSADPAPRLRRRPPRDDAEREHGDPFARCRQRH